MMSILFAMAKKDLKLLFRDKVTLFFTFGFPLLFSAFSGRFSHPATAVAVCRWP